MAQIMTMNAPKSWQVHRLGQLFRERKEKGSDSKFPPLSVTKQGIVPQLKTAAKTDDGGNRKIVRIGDYVINSRSDRRGSGGISQLEGSTSQISIVLEPKNILPEYAHYLLRSFAFQEEFYRSGHGIVADLWTTRYSDMKSIRLAVPDIKTQRKIAIFLDREFYRISLLITKKQRMIEVLNEKIKTITHAHVFKLEANNFERKFSSVSWMPNFPTHWKFQRCAQIFKNLDFYRIHINPEERADLSKIYPYYGPSGIIDWIDEYILDQDTILVSQIPANFGIQSAQIAFKGTGKYSVNNHVSILKPHAGCIDYWIHALNQVPYEAYVAGVTMPMLTAVTLGNIKLPVPPICEQFEIADKINSTRCRIESLVEPIRESIKLLCEYRTALITAAVTGKIDVNLYNKSESVDY